MMLNQPAIPAPGECIPNVELFRRLAKTMGFDDAYWDMTDDEMLLDFYDWSSPQLEGITLDLLKEKGYMRLNVGDPDKRAPHANGNFKTASGKCELKSSATANFVVPVWRSMYEGMQPGEPIDPLPDYIAPYESPESNPELAQRYPLRMVSPKPHAFLNTQYGNEERQQVRQGEQKVLLHPADARERGIANASVVRVFNDRGSFEGLAELSEDLMPGLVMANVGYWPSLNRSGTSVNSISSDKHCTLGQAGSYSDNLVQVAAA
jgi:anaerobic selenocysteine-containing dehydrogenase